MKIIHENQAEKIKNSDSCFATEYPIGDKDVSIAYIEVLGRYPQKGNAMNEKCKELVYIIDGQGKIVVNEEEVELNKNDVVLLEAGEQYYWDGNMRMLIYCSPAWYPGQYKEINI